MKPQKFVKKTIMRPQTFVKSFDVAKENAR